ncbi:cytochrome P450, putative [Talaromyces stipitatus ATCC 10500]|uniref:Cytochrome P450, putative n=1 Tax=Talaromyces stipitatus (strain ATCC 10500 / CBS 375.48 / QM 6759 / NRRL 1006) TaxID=441959 RepID=B8M7U9_TALSN|nr:cytochrome P450, putative [Talaromyces stipitatus ATCC 10500]EED19828.1 cytochrome P450, putative [Talaromyces stipitatus ATCC 10500]
MLFQASAILIALIGLSVLVNVVSQLVANRQGNNPPLVFHYFPIIGSTVSYGKHPLKFFEECRQKYGNVFTFILVGRRVTVYLGAQGNNFVLNGKQSELSAEDVYSRLTTPVFGSGVIFDCETSKFLQQKKFIKFGLSQPALESYVRIIAKEATDFFKTYHDFNVKEKSKTGILEVTSAMAELTIYTASSCLQGAEVRQQFSSGGSRIANLYHDLDMGFTPINFFLPSWVPLPRNHRRDVAQREMTRFYTDIITKRRLHELQKTKTSATAENAEAKDMIWNLMRNSTYKDGSKLSDRDIAHIMIALLLGGHHSSSAVIAFSILSLASNPVIQEELYEEQVRELGDGELTYDKLQRLKLHANVIKETLRLYNPIHSIMRLARKPLLVPVREDNNDSHARQLLIPQGDILLASPAFSARDGSYFSNPLKWDPHRWEGNDAIHYNDDDDSLGKGANSPYLPFGGGRHRCIGEKFAYIQLGVILAIFVKSFRVTAIDKSDGSLLEIDYSSLFSRPQWPGKVAWERRPCQA